MGDGVVAVPASAGETSSEGSGDGVGEAADGSSSAVGDGVDPTAGVLETSAVGDVAPVSPSGPPASAGDAPRTTAVAAANSERAIG